MPSPSKIHIESDAIRFLYIHIAKKPGSGLLRLKHLSYSFRYGSSDDFLNKGQKRKGLKNGSRSYIRRIQIRGGGLQIRIRKKCSLILILKENHRIREPKNEDPVQ